MRLWDPRGPISGMSSEKGSHLPWVTQWIRGWKKLLTQSRKTLPTILSAIARSILSPLRCPPESRTPSPHSPHALVSLHPSRGSSCPLGSARPEQKCMNQQIMDTPDASQSCDFLQRASSLLTPEVFLHWPHPAVISAATFQGPPTPEVSLASCVPKTCGNQCCRRLCLLSMNKSRPW